MSIETKHVICRACHVQCGLLVNFENGIAVNSHGDKHNPVYHGYSCLKGRELFRYHSSPSRLTSSLKKQDDGSFLSIAWQSAAQEAAQKINDIAKTYGPESIAMYIGTFGFNHLADQAFARAFFSAIESDMVFTSVTIDQPGKAVSGAAHGSWLAGAPRVEEWDGLMLVGTNPLVSQNGGLGANPARILHHAQKRGMELIVLDPRVTDVAAKADLHIQLRPGEDISVIAAIIRQILVNGDVDDNFIKAESEGLEELRTAVEQYTPKKVANRAGIDTSDIVMAAEMIGRWDKGHFSAGTGPNMSGFGNLVEYLLRNLTTLKGFWKRPGDIRKNAGVFINPAPPIAASTGPYPVKGFGKKLRTRDLEQLIVDLPTAALADEILTPGDGQIKALLVLGGNPVLAWPDQLKTVEAMKALDLLICIDPRMSKTCDYADYVIAPKIHYETPGLTALNEMLGGFGAGWGFTETYGQVCPPALVAPEGCCDGHEFFHAMAKELNLKLEIKSFAYINDPNTQKENTTIVTPSDEIDAFGAWAAALNGSPVSVEEAFADPDMLKGKISPDNGVEIQPKPENWPGKFALANPYMMSEIERYQTENLSKLYDVAQSAYPFRLISRRLNDIHNSNWHEIPSLRKRMPHHPAYLNPEDMDKLKINAGDIVKITSEIAAISAVAVSAPDVRPGCLSVPHSWGTGPDETDDPKGAGGNTGRLTSVETNFDPISGMPIMSAIPVHLEKV